MTQSSRSPVRSKRHFKQLSSALKELRTRQGLSLGDLASCGISRSYLYNIESQLSCPRPRKFLKIALSLCSTDAEFQNLRFIYLCTIGISPNTAFFPSTLATIPQGFHLRGRADLLKGRTNPSHPAVEDFIRLYAANNVLSDQEFRQGVLVCIGQELPEANCSCALRGALKLTL